MQQLARKKQKMGGGIYMKSTVISKIVLQVYNYYISCLWLWFLLARWIDSELHALFSLYDLGLTVYMIRCNCDDELYIYTPHNTTQRKWKHTHH